MACSEDQASSTGAKQSEPRSPGVRRILLERIAAGAQECMGGSRDHDPGLRFIGVSGCRI